MAGMDAVRKLREELLEEVAKAVEAHTTTAAAEVQRKRAMLDAVAAAVAAGCDGEAVAERAGVSKGTVQRWAREAEDQEPDGEIPGQQPLGGEAPAVEA